MFKNLKLIDLTHTLSPQAPSWNGDCGFRSEIKLDYDGGCRVQKLYMEAGIGTHMDAPVHFIPKAKSIAQLSLENFFVQVCVLDVSHRVSDDDDYEVSVKDIEEYEHVHGNIPEKSLFLAHTGWSKRWHNPDHYRNVKDDGVMHFPTYDVKAVEVLLERNIVGIGIDSLSPDKDGSQFPVHHAMLKAGKYIVENVAHLHHMPPQGACVVVLPLSIKDGAESPVRIVGLVHK